MPDTAQERRQTDRDIAGLLTWKEGHTEQCEEREKRTAETIGRLEKRFDRIDERFDEQGKFLRGFSAKLFYMLLAGGAFAIWEVVSPHINLH